MRFAVARQQGLTEEIAALVDDGYRDSALDDRSKAVLAFADSFLSARPVDTTTAAALTEHFSEPQVAELALALALFHGFSKMLIVLGLEPEQMDTTVLPTPDVPSR